MAGGKNGLSPVPDDVFDFFASEETTTLYLTPQLWVRIKKELDFGEQNELDNAALRGFSQQQLREKADAGELIYHTDLGKQRLLKLALYIDDWNLHDREGKTIRWPRKVDERVALLRRMNPKVATTIGAEIDRLIGEKNEQLKAEGYEALPEGQEEQDPLSPRVIEGKAR